MADDVVVADPETTVEPVDVVESPPPVESSPAEELARLREDKARLEGELMVLRRQPPPPVAAQAPAPPPATVYTPEQIEAAFAENKIDAARKGQEYARYTEHVAQQAAQAAREQERTQALTESIGTRIQAHIAIRPTLAEPYSAETQTVRAWVTERGGDFSDRRWQLAACDALWGVKGAVVDRRQLPGGSGGGRPAPIAPGGTASKADPLKGIPDDVVAYWRGTGANLADPAKAQWYASRYWSRRQRA